MAISVRERTSELAVFKAIGYSDRMVLFFVLAESLVIALIGGFIGLALATLAIPGLARLLNGLLPSIVLAPRMILYGWFLAVFVGLISGLIPGILAMRMRVITALRRV
jgi:putative ABC transport system permease protein